MVRARDAKDLTREVGGCRMTRRCSSVVCRRVVGEAMNECVTPICVVDEQWCRRRMKAMLKDMPLVCEARCVALLSFLIVVDGGFIDKGGLTVPRVPSRVFNGSTRSGSISPWRASAKPLLLPLSQERPFHQ